MKHKSHPQTINTVIYPKLFTFKVGNLKYQTYKHSAVPMKDNQDVGLANNFT